MPAASARAPGPRCNSSRSITTRSPSPRPDAPRVPRHPGCRMPRPGRSSMKLIDMRTDDTMPTDEDTDGASYPPGLRLTLDDTALDKLGCDDVGVGDTVTLTARANVVS